ncbi:LTA synthase family protein [Luteimonas sp BLCC-B24]|uniref:LTA synthase family protein n=1 Tax=Luteimonas sp. BLCC-B24 TaxID=3025317 RepID=UPI00234D3C04|nr:LTA synthase family protein [Luteimonas sp. BLCC-B24]MDC7807939.1 LTA synthase family protein [Luteimonas sp. BLCC-B24]
MSLALCGLMAVIAHYYFDFTYTAAATIATGLLLSPVLIALGPSFRSFHWGAVLCIVLAGILMLGNPLKIAMMRMPLSFQDLQALPVLLNTLSGRRLAVAIALIGGFFALLAWMLRIRAGTLLSVLLAAGYIAAIPSALRASSSVAEVALPVGLPSHEMYDGEVVKLSQNEDPIAFLKGRGPILYLAQDWLDRYAEREGPTRAEIEKLPLQPWQPLAQPPKRNIHIVLMESLWDVSSLAHHRTNTDPLDPRFRALWEVAGRPYALSPVFGGATANAEFEVLCGFPAPRNSVAFVGLLRRPSPCLPAALNAYGYHTVASHAHEESNWNRNNAYKASGFSFYRPVSAFELDDMEGAYLYDGSFFRQNLDYLTALSPDVPVLNYQVTLSSHWGYSRNHDARPDLVSVEPADSPLLNAYVNAVAYSTRALMDWTVAILSADPDAIIIALGDHAPVLTGGTAPDVYDQVNVSDTGHFDSDDTRAKLALSRTPLLVIDGDRGPVTLTRDVPLYELPGLISDLLGEGELLPQSSQSAPSSVRPFLGHLLANANGDWHNCAHQAPLADSESCKAARAHFEKLRTLRADSIQGNRYFLRNLDAHLTLVHSADTDMTIDGAWESCLFEVNQWGPQQAARDGYNLQPDGSSNIWITMKRLRGRPTVHIGTVQGEATYGSGVITARFDDDLLRSIDRDLPVTLQCEKKPPLTIGHIMAAAAPDAMPSP